MIYLIVRRSVRNIEYESAQEVTSTAGLWNLKLRWGLSSKVANRCQFWFSKWLWRVMLISLNFEMPEWTWKRRHPRSAKLQQCQTIKVSVCEWKKFCTTCRNLAKASYRRTPQPSRRFRKLHIFRYFDVLRFISSYWLGLRPRYTITIPIFENDIDQRSGGHSFAVPHSAETGVGNDHLMGPRVLKTPSYIYAWKLHQEAEWDQKVWFWQLIDSTIVGFI